MFGESCYSLLVWPLKGQFSYHCSYIEKYFDFYRPVFLMAACLVDVCERDGEGANPSTTVMAVPLRAVRCGSTTLISPVRAHLTTSFFQRCLLVGELEFHTKRAIILLLGCLRIIRTWLMLNSYAKCMFFY